MNTRRVEFILDYISNHADDEFFYLNLHSLFNCLSEQDISSIYFQYGREISLLRRTIESYVVKRTTSLPLRNFDSVALELIKSYPDTDPKSQVAIRVFVSQFIRSQSKSVVKAYFEVLIHSHKIVDRRRAGEVADLIWDEKVEEMILENFSKYGDEDSLTPLAQSLNIIGLNSLLKRHLTPSFPSYRLKAQIAKRLVKLPVADFEYVKETDPCYFTQLMATKRLKVDRATIKLLKEAMSGSVYTVWYLGLAGEWNTLVAEIKKQNLPSG